MNDRMGMRAAGAVAFVVLSSTALGGLPPFTSASAESRPAVDGLVSGMFVAGAVIAAIVGWRRHARSRAGWTLAAGALLAAQALLVTLPTVAYPRPLVGIDLAAVLGVGVVGLAFVLGALAGLRKSLHVADDCFAIGLGMGFVAAAHLMLLLPAGAPLAVPLQVLIGLLVGTHLTVAGIVLVHRVLPPPTARLLAVTAAVVAVALTMTGAGLHRSLPGTLLALALAAVGAAWLALAWDSLQLVDEPVHEQLLPDVDDALLAAHRDQRERLHELRSTVAGLVNGSTLLESADIPLESRQRLWESVRSELDRMQRLLSGEDDDVAHLDLDKTLGLILDVQRLKGREVELHSSGDAVRARYDSLAEVVNILMDNAATHGGSDTSLVEVVRRDDEMIDITVTDFGTGIPADQREQIFDWGRRGADSPGEGIGLNLAQRLVAQDGGSLRLAETHGTGSAFVISLPAVRQSTENHVSEQDGHDTWRRSG
jgi:signal transduction histidine kinase